MTALRPLSLSLLLALLPGGCGRGPDVGSVILVVIDTLRADHLGCYGNPDARTPQLDRLARRGLQWETVITQVPVTAPSVSTILTGTAPPHHGVRDNGFFTLDDRLPTLAETFRDAGRNTAAFISAAVLDRRYGTARGFNTYDDDLSKPYVIHRADLKSEEAGHQDVERRGRDTVARASSWLGAQGADPFFLMVHLFDPHDPYDPPPPYGLRPGRTLYDQEITEADRCIGRLLRSLDRRAFDRGTAVAVVSDHGEGLGEHGESTHGFLLHDSTVRVPWILSGTSFRGVRRGPRRLMDVAPTLLAVGGRSETIGDGRDATGDGTDTAPAYLETYRTLYSYEWSPLEGLRTADWKLVRAPRPELYDLVRDPRELENLYEERPELVRDLAARLDAFLDSAAPETAEPSPLDDETRRRLEALGYLGGPDEAPADSGERIDPKDGLLGFELRQRAKVRLVEGRDLLSHGLAAQAEAAVRDAIEMAPDYGLSYFDLARIQASRGESAAAEGNLRLAVEREPGLGPAWTLRALLAYAERRDDDAGAYFTEAWSRTREDWARRNLWEFLVRTERFDDAAALLDEAEGHAPEDPWIVPARAYVMARSGRLDEEAAFWRDARGAGAGTRPPDARFRAVVLETRATAPEGVAARRDGRVADAVTAFEAAHARHPALATAWALARALTAAGETERAASLLEREDADPVRDAHRLAALGELALARGDAAAASAAFTQAVNRTEGVFPGWRAELWYGLARAAQALGREDAPTLFTKALDDSYGSPWEADAVARGGRVMMARNAE